MFFSTDLLFKTKLYCLKKKLLFKEKITLHDFDAQSKPEVFKMFYENTNTINIFS